MDEITANIGKNIGILCRQLNVYLNRELEKYDVTASETMYLGALFMQDGMIQDELSSRFCVDKAAVARTIGSLENKGLVTRKSSETDRRSKQVFLTDKALEYRDILFSIQDRWYRETIAKLDKESVNIFANVLSSISLNTQLLNAIQEKETE